MNYKTFSKILMAIEPEISKEQVIGGHKIIKPAVRLTLALRFLATVQMIDLLFFTGRWQCLSHIALSPSQLPPLTEKLLCTIIRLVKQKKNYHELSCRI